jgi:preprotein translocase subunit YajC
MDFEAEETIFSFFFIIVLCFVYFIFFYTNERKRNRAHKISYDVDNQWRHNLEKKL